MKSYFIPIIPLLAFLLYSCNDEIAVQSTVLSEQEHYTLNSVDDLQLKFGKILSAAISDHPELRDLIKTEALKKFNNDHDVLYQLIKNRKVGNLSVSELLASYAERTDEFSLIEKSLPLLTILVPTLPDFNPDSWDTSREIPLVALKTADGGGIPLINRDGKIDIIPQGLVPGFPVLVVKQNERITINNGNNLKSANSIVGNDFTFSYLDAAFNGSIANEKSTYIPSNLDQAVIDAYDSGVEWQRDYIYYGLTASNTKGSFKNGYYEYLTGFNFAPDDRWYQKIADQTPDPTLRFGDRIISGAWIDGMFEFRVTVLLNGKNGIGSTIDKYFSASPNDVMSIIYNDDGPPRKGQNFYHTVKSVKGKEYNPNLELVQWDLKNYGASWKISVSEVDNSEEITQSEEVTTQYATNFEITAGIEKKIGYKFGASNSVTNKSSFTIKSKKESDSLGDAVINFGDPIILSETIVNTSSSFSGRRPNYISVYNVHEISTGGYLNLVIMPKKKY